MVGAVFCGLLLWAAWPRNYESPKERLSFNLWPRPSQSLRAQNRLLWHNLWIRYKNSSRATVHVGEYLGTRNT